MFVEMYLGELNGVNTQTAKLQFLNEAGVDIIQTIGIGGAVQYSLNQNGGVQYIKSN